MENNTDIYSLTISRVKFYDNDYPDPELAHTYWLGDEQLKGVTSTLIRFAFPDLYKGVPLHNLQAAAKRGNDIHDQVQSFAVWGGTPTVPEEQSYETISKEYGFKVIDTEYLVSDEQSYASAIDMVAVNAEGKIILIDIKTTSERHYEPVSLQLSIYADWFENQNKDLKVEGLYLMWLRGEEYRFEQVPRVPSKKIQYLKKAYERQDSNYVYDVTPKWISLKTKKMSKLIELIDKYTEQLEVLKEETMSQMTDEYLYTAKGNGLTISRVSGGTSARFDSKKFSADHPDLYSEYTKEVKKKEYITIKKSTKK